MIVNSKMAALLATADQETGPRELPDELRELLAGGWQVCASGILILTAPDDPIVTSTWEVEEVGITEYDVNDIRVPDEDCLDDPDSYLRRMVLRGLAFARAGLHRATDVVGAETLHAALSTGIDEDFLTHGTTVRFFTQRGIHPHWFDNLERYEVEALALLDMSDAVDC